MGATEAGKCRGCGATLTLLNRAVDMSEYCGKCASKSQADPDSALLPLDIDIESITRAGLGADVARFAWVVLVAAASCFGGALVGAIVGGPDPINRQTDSLQASWLFGLVGLFIGKLIFLRRGKALTFARWGEFWACFIPFYFLTYIPLAVYLPRSLPALDVLTFLPACIIGFAAGTLVVKVRDRSVKARLCERCALPPRILEAAHSQDCAEATRLIEQLASCSDGLVPASDLMGRLHLARAVEKLTAGDSAGATDCVNRAREIGVRSETIRLRIAVALDEVGQHSDAIGALGELADRAKDKDIRSRASKLAKAVRKANAMRICCPSCSSEFWGTHDMAGDMAVCSKCKAEFAVPTATSS